MLKTILRTDDLPEKDRFDYFYQIIQDAIPPTMFRVDRTKDFHSTLRALDLGATYVMHTTVLSPRPPSQAPEWATWANRPVRLIRQHDPEHVHLNLVVGGVGGTDIGNRQASVGVGDMFFYDSSHPFNLWAGTGGRNSPTCTQVHFRFPRALLPNPGLVDQLLGARLAPRRGLRTLLADHLRELTDPAAEYRAADAPALATITLDLIAALLAHELDAMGSLPPATRQRALLAKVHAFIDEHLADPELTPTAVAEAHYISIRYLHKLFHEQGTTVAGWIRRQRLERCHRDLIDPRLRTRTVHAVAARWGFTDKAHFSRLFRGAYGMAPKDYRHLHQDDCGND
jgi:AraC-like DNA-binding protein